MKDSGVLAQRKSSQFSISIIPSSGMHSSGIIYRVSGLSGWPPTPSGIGNLPHYVEDLYVRIFVSCQGDTSGIFYDDFGVRDGGKLGDFMGLMSE